MILWFPHKSGWDSGRKIKKEKKKEAIKKEKAQNNKKREKERRGNATILLPHLCFRVAPCSSYRESPELSLSYTSGNFHYRTWLVYSTMGFLTCPRSSWASKLDAHSLSFSLSFHTLLALSASVAWQSIHIALISIDGHLHSPLISRVDVRLSYFFVFFIFTPINIIYSTHSAMSMACAHVLREGWKSWSALKSMNQLLGLSSGLCMINTLC